MSAANTKDIPDVDALPPPPPPSSSPSNPNPSMPIDLSMSDPHSGPPTLKKEGSDWFALFTPVGEEQKRAFDVQLIHTLMHERRPSEQGRLLILRSVCFSPDGKKCVRTRFEGHQQELYSLDFAHDGRLTVSGSNERTARIWDTVSNMYPPTVTIPEPENVVAGVTSGTATASVYSVAFTPDGHGLVSGSLDKTLKYWDVRPLIRRDRTSGPSGGAGAAVPARGSLGKNDAGGEGSAGSAKEGSGTGEKGSQSTMNFTGLLSGSKDRGVRFWDANTAVAQCMLQGHKNSVIFVDLSLAGNVFATGGGDWQARIFMSLSRWSYETL
ncbi:WD40-repeat-containing domain protein [Trametes punicea]|nr:WD40-repeat-containing domain protein [Trametes punicea]